MLKHVFALSLGLGLISVPGAPTYACETDSYIGSICWTGADFCPKDFKAANGDLMPLNSTENQALFSVLGLLYGGDGRSTFALPDLSGREAIGPGQDVDGQPLGVGTQVGREDTMLVSANVPEHVHALDNEQIYVTVTRQASGNAATAITPQNNVSAVVDPQAPKIYASSSNGAARPEGMAPDHVTARFTSDTTILTGTAGAKSTPLNILGRQLGMTACIRVSGTYPPR